MKIFKKTPAIIILLVCLSSAAMAQIVVQPPAETNLKQIKALVALLSGWMQYPT